TATSQSSSGMAKSLRRSAVHGQAARHADRLPGNECSIVAGQETDGARNILRLADALHRNGVDERRPHPLAALALTGGGGEQWRVGWARANGVEGDAAPRHFAGHGF